MSINKGQAAGWMGADAMGSSPELRAGPQTTSQKFWEALLALQATQTYEVNGDDISVYQGEIDWTLHAAKVDFSIIRYSYGNDGIDIQAERNVQNAVDHGTPYCGYHYIKPALSWQKNAANFAAQVNRFKGNLYAVGDLEETGGLAKQALAGWTEKFWREVEQKIGAVLACYTSAGFLNTAMPLTSWLKHKPLIVASWTNGPVPLIPLEWSVPGLSFEAWQWKVLRPPTGYGVQSGGLDLDRWNLSQAAFNAKFGVTVPPPPVDPPPVVTSGIQMEVIQDGLRIRPEPKTGTIVLGTLPAGTIVTATNVGGQDAWVEIGPGRWANVQQGSDVNMRKV